MRLGGVHPPRPARRRAALSWRWGPVATLAVLLYCAWIGHLEWRSWTHLHSQEVALADQAAVLARQQAALRAEIAYDSTPAYVEGVARQEFGLVAAGEVPLAPVTAGSGSAGPVASGG